MTLASRLWLFERRAYYHGIPVISSDRFRVMLRDISPDYFNGYRIYFVRATQYADLNPLVSTPEAANLEQFLQEGLGKKPAVTIMNREGQPTMQVYTFTTD